MNGLLPVYCIAYHQNGDITDVSLLQSCRYVKSWIHAQLRLLIPVPLAILHLDLQSIALPDRAPRTAMLEWLDSGVLRRLAHCSGNIFSNGRCLKQPDDAQRNGSHWDPSDILPTLPRMASECISRCRRLLWTHIFRGTVPKLSWSRKQGLRRFLLWTSRLLFPCFDSYYSVVKATMLRRRRVATKLLRYGSLTCYPVHILSQGFHAFLITLFTLPLPRP